MSVELKKMNLEERLNRIDDFFDKLSDDEFEEMCYECGAGIIKESAFSSYNIPTDNLFKAKYVNNLNLKQPIEQVSFFNNEISRGAA